MKKTLEKGSVYDVTNGIESVFNVLILDVLENISSYCVLKYGQEIILKESYFEKHKTVKKQFKKQTEKELEQLYSNYFKNFLEREEILRTDKKNTEKRNENLNLREQVLNDLENKEDNSYYILNTLLNSKFEGKYKPYIKFISSNPNRTKLRLVFTKKITEGLTEDSNLEMLPDMLPENEMYVIKNYPKVYSKYVLNVNTEEVRNKFNTYFKDKLHLSDVDLDVSNESKLSVGEASLFATLELDFHIIHEKSLDTSSKIILEDMIKYIAEVNKLI